MAAGQETISLRWQAELGDLRRQMAEIPGITEKEAKAMARALDRQMKAAGKAAEKAAKQSKSGWAGFGKTIKAAAGAALGAAAAFTAVKTAVLGMTKGVIDSRNQLSDLSIRTAQTTETLEAMRLAAEGTGMEFAPVAKALEKIPKLLADADNGLSTAVRAFKNLGIETHDAEGKIRSASDVFGDFRVEIDKIEDPTLKAARAADLLGAKMGGTVLQALQGGAEHFEVLRREADAFGVDAGPAAMEAAASMQRDFARLGLVMRGAKADLVDAFGSGKDEGLDILTHFGSMLRYTVEVIKGYSNVKTVGFLDAFDGDEWKRWGEDIGQVFIDAQDAAEGFYKLTDEERKTVDGASAALAAYTDEIERNGDSRGKLSKAEKDRIEAAKEMATIAKISAEATSDLLSDTEKLTNAYIEQTEPLLAIIEAHNAEGEIAAAAMVALEKAMERLNREKYAIETEEAEKLHALQMSQAEELEDLKQQHREAAEAANAQRMQQIADERMAAAAAAADLFGSVSQLAEMAAKKQGEANAAAGKRWFDWYQGLAIAQAVINGAVAASKAIADYGLPWGIPIAAASVAAAGVQVAMISQESPPSSYHVGGMAYDAPALAPDEGTSIVRSGEGVLTERGVGAIGGPQGLADANRGNPPAAGPTVIQMVYKHRVFGEVVKDSYRLPGSPLRSAIKGGSRVGHRQR